MLDGVQTRDERIDELECHLAISDSKHKNAIAEIERLRAALEKVRSWYHGSEITSAELEQALAAAEEESDD